ncbi:tyrosine-protein phosphatase [Promicromonospora sp. NPDC057138]|uniref:tyrosine-protein phosphatase n=1 Tax=Promicromonospora sp. NPDC057138 TaxID=3346031 RepID=UPI0036333A9C
MTGTTPPADSQPPAWDRWIDTAGAVFNFRDIGAYTTARGRVRTGLIYRADSLASVPATTLAGMGIRTVVDLRSDAEVSGHGRFQSAAAVTYAHCPVAYNPWDDAATSAATVQAFLTERYLEIADIGRNGIRETLDLLADPQRRPMVFHCRAGKDRTGVLAAVLLALLGVGDDDVDADYALSNTAYARFCASRGHDPQAAVREAAATSSPPGTASAVLHSLRARFGSIEAYLIAIGVSPGVLYQLRESLIDASPGTS